MWPELTPGEHDRIRRLAETAPPLSDETWRQLRELLEPYLAEPAPSGRTAVVAPRDPWDAALSAVRSSADDLGAWLAIWSARREPDAHARRCASDAVDAIDAALIELHGIRAQLVGEIRRADDQAAARVDALLAGTGTAPGRGRSRQGPSQTELQTRPGRRHPPTPL